MKTWTTSEIKAIYYAYPKQVGVRAATKAIVAALDRGVPYQKLLLRTMAYAAAVKRDGTDKRYIPYPATWYNRGSYDDADLARVDTAKERLKARYQEWRGKHKNLLLDGDFWDGFYVFLKLHGPDLPADLKPEANRVWRWLLRTVSDNTGAIMKCLADAGYEPAKRRQSDG